MAMALGILARGVLRDGRPLFGVGRPPPIPVARPLRPGFGVENGDPVSRVGDDKVRDGEERERMGLSTPPIRREGLSGPASRELNCFAVIDMYLEALEPAVNWSVGGAVSGLDAVDLVSVRRARAAGVTPGVIRPDEKEGVILPLIEGVVRPFDREFDAEMRDLENVEESEGVTRPDNAGVMRPPRDDATEDGRGMAPAPTVGGESLTVATKTPQLSGQEK